MKWNATSYQFCGTILQSKVCKGMFGYTPSDYNHNISEFCFNDQTVSTIITHTKPTRKGISSRKLHCSITWDKLKKSLLFLTLQNSFP